MKNRSRGGRSSTDLSEAEDSLVRLSSNLLELCSHAPPPGLGALLNDHNLFVSMINELTREQTGNLQQSNLNSARKTDLGEFLSWCKERGVYCDGVDVAVVSDVEGYGLVASRDIKKGECLVKVPLKAMLTLHDARISKTLAKPIEKDPLLKGMPNVALAMFILIEKLKGAESEWEPYLSMLPTEYSTPLYFNDQELGLLKGSPILEATLKLYRNIARQFAYFHQLLATPTSVFWKGHVAPLTLFNFTFDMYRWAVVTVMTRINLVPSPDSSCPDRMPALIPYFDLANHRGGPQYPVTTDYSDHLLMGLCYAQADFTPGSQVYINYGARPNADLLLHDGFVPEGQNPDDTHKIKLGLSKNDKHAMQRCSVLQGLGIIESRSSGHHSYEFEIPVIGLQKPIGDMVEIRWRPLITTNLQAFARVFTADEEVLKETLEEIESKMSVSASTKIGGVKNEIKAWTFLKNRFSLLLRGYATPGEMHQTTRVCMALRLINAEKHLLQAAANYAEDEIKELMQANTQEIGDSTKT